MKTLEKGQDKIQKICDRLRHEVIEPANKEAEDLVAAAHKKSEQIIAEAHKRVEEMHKNARTQIEQERRVFQASLKQAAKQAVEALRQEIEHKLFNEELQSKLEQPLSQPQLVAQLIEAIIPALEREGLETDLSVIIPRTVSSAEVSHLLAEGVRQRLKKHPLEIGKFAGGIQVRLVGKKMTIDLSDQALKELLSNYVRKDFRELIFGH